MQRIGFLVPNMVKYVCSMWLNSNVCIDIFPHDLSLKIKSLMYPMSTLDRYPIEKNLFLLDTRHKIDFPLDTRSVIESPVS